MRMPKASKNLLAALPSVDEVLRSQHGQGWLARYPRRFVLQGIRDEIARLRERVKAGAVEPPAPEDTAAAMKVRISRLSSPSLRPVINATGIVLHTNLGRAPLSESALDAVVSVSRGYSNLEYALEEGKRGKRHSHARRLIKELASAEDATLFNNNAGAVLIALSALARGREVIVSRGELVEIGGSFRIPEVMAQSGAILREVGATNKTHLRDYENAIGPETALLLKVHRSNYRITGFSAEVSVESLVKLGAEKGIPVMFDLGSGCLFDLKKVGIGDEPVVNEIVRSGVDLVTFSGDKLLGGPQAGIIAGKTALIEKINRHPLARALRIDKMTLAALEATLFDCADIEKAPEKIPALRMLLEPAEKIRGRARAIAKKAGAGAKVVEDLSEAGGGSLPGVLLPTWCVAVKGHKSPNSLELLLRKGDPPVIARIKEGTLLLDARTIMDGDVEPLARRLKEIL
ncbi:MAG: L-seryl-tRNA(Sec) selenium transferase [Actinomycetota bacterium]|nr:L-seryl-tRNA(Sec) selenium transferase [Actinomycetota bacterium]